MSHESGFTILEMLVALAILSLGAVALLNLAGENTRTAALLQSRLFAGVVADNRAIEALTASVAPGLGTESGVETAGGTAWRWTRSVTASADRDVLRIAIAVTPADGGRPAAQAVLFRVLR